MHLTKHHGLGNDFVVLVDLDRRHPIDEDIAVRVCDRHRGIGADGLLRVTPGDEAEFRMELRNEDGSRAEMSGNGISCLAQALVRAGHVGSGDGGTAEIRIETDAGLRVVRVVDSAGPAHHRMQVGMGQPLIGDRLPVWEDDVVGRAVAVDVGNPHIVCHVTDPGRVPDLDAFGRRVNEATAGGANVELIWPGPTGTLVMQVYERGVGPTEACGTGAVAAAVAGHAWGLGPARVTVRQPGGDADVELGEHGARLTVPVVAIAEIVWPL